MKKSLAMFALWLAMGAAQAGDISAILAAPIYRQPYACSEDWQGKLRGLGDELGQDCWIQDMADAAGRAWMQAYSGSGRENSDWFGWNKDVLAPCQCEVVDTRDNPVVNRPGVPGRPPSSFIKLRRDDGVFFQLTQVTRFRVKPGDRVKPGQILGQVGNNGYASQPHIHIGAWKGKDPLQIRFDQQRMQDLFEE